MSTRQEQMEAFGRFLDVLDELREKCPWDRKQTNESLRPNTIEEVYELCDALINEDDTNICKELGDVLLHVAFYAKIASEKGAFDMKDVCDRLCEKPRHSRMSGRGRTRHIDHIVVVSVDHALCPPICLFRSIAVAPSSRFMPLTMAFFPNFFLISITVCCIRFSRS